MRPSRELYHKKVFQWEKLLLTISIEKETQNAKKSHKKE